MTKDLRIPRRATEAELWELHRLLTQYFLDALSKDKPPTLSYAITPEQRARQRERWRERVRWWRQARREERVPLPAREWLRMRSSR